ncbi:hypothetical protein BD324DRAFT_17147 [Kockovaella imperatae]|uniref:Uncharacterized protein n=1 Tax=Kockovaella imperatae TaxID=4999 RepID=A0A1Y1URN3_9TREE|nr:hypothetical protein BD324DRAFT_17147 [Kockovaella imperatae]ORX40721.1 hypothetical protein BD324DRAFT_17147 [Kockovaella imperatae]
MMVGAAVAASGPGPSTVAYRAALVLRRGSQTPCIPLSVNQRKHHVDLQSYSTTVRSSTGDRYHRGLRTANDGRIPMVHSYQSHSALSVRLAHSAAETQTRAHSSKLVTPNHRDSKKEPFVDGRSAEGSDRKGQNSKRRTPKTWHHDTRKPSVDFPSGGSIAATPLSEASRKGKSCNTLPKAHARRHEQGSPKLRRPGSSTATGQPLTFVPSDNIIPNSIAIPSKKKSGPEADKTLPVPLSASPERTASGERTKAKHRRRALTLDPLKAELNEADQSASKADQNATTGQITYAAERPSEVALRKVTDDSATPTQIVEDRPQSKPIWKMKHLLEKAKTFDDYIQAFHKTWNPELAAETTPYVWSRISVCIQGFCESPAGKKMIAERAAKQDDRYFLLRDMAVETAGRDFWQGLFALSATLLAAQHAALVDDIWLRYKEKLFQVQGKNEQDLTSWDRQKRLAARPVADGIDPMNRIYLAAIAALDISDTQVLINVTGLRGRLPMGAKVIETIDEAIRTYPDPQEVRRRYLALRLDVKRAGLLMHGHAAIEYIKDVTHTNPEGLVQLYDWILKQATGPNPLLRVVPWDATSVTLHASQISTDFALTRTAFSFVTCFPSDWGFSQCRETLESRSASTGAHTAGKRFRQCSVKTRYLYAASQKSEWRHARM